jgi:hypothetical protein
MSVVPYFVEFRVDERQLEGIRRVVAALKEDKEDEEDKEAAAPLGIRKYAALFGPEALDRLWWPERRSSWRCGLTR